MPDGRHALSSAQLTPCGPVPHFFANCAFRAEHGQRLKFDVHTHTFRQYDPITAVKQAVIHAYAIINHVADWISTAMAIAPGGAPPLIERQALRIGMRCKAQQAPQPLSALATQQNARVRRCARRGNSCSAPLAHDSPRKTACGHSGPHAVLFDRLREAWRAARARRATRWPQCNAMPCWPTACTAPAPTAMPKRLARRSMAPSCSL